MNKPTINIALSDFPGPTHVDLIWDLLSKRYTLISSQDPDYVIYSAFGSEYFRYRNAVRIQFLTENIRPDFNLCDYAMSFDWLDFGDRHYRMPNFVLYPQWQDLLSRGSSNLNGLSSKPHFCNFIYSNGNGHPARREFFEALNKRLAVDSLGSYLRNSNRLASPPYKGEWSQTKVDLQRSFRFSIAFENSISPGYTTEKIVHALSADTVPIYWGDPQISRVFNPERFINVQELGFDAAIDRVLFLQNNDRALLSVLGKPFLCNNEAKRSLEPTVLLDVFSRIFNQPKHSARRRDEFSLAVAYESNRKSEIAALKIHRRIMRPILSLKRVCARLAHLGAYGGR